MKMRIISKEGQQIAIAGITDFRAHQIKPEHRSDPKKAIDSISDNMIKIMLAHQPNSIYAVHDAGVDLQLSGHTHGGQFWPLTYQQNLQMLTSQGTMIIFGTQIYVNRGTGYWGPPLRIGVPSEITVFPIKEESALMIL